MDLFVETSAMGSAVWVTDIDGELLAGTWLADTEWNGLLDVDVMQWVAGLGLHQEIGSDWIRHDEWLRSVGVTSPANESEVAALHAMVDRAMVDEVFAEWLETGVRGPG